jgi:hypothetical protein
MLAQIVAPYLNIYLTGMTSPHQATSWEWYKHQNVQQPDSMVSPPRP